MVADGDSLAQLAQRMFVETVAQFRLAHEQELQQLAAIVLENVANAML